MGASYTLNLLLVGVLVALSRGVSSVDGYRAFSGKQNYSEAHMACKRRGFAYLAKIKNLNELKRAKNITNTTGGVEYWTGLHVKNNNWKWSDGKEATDIFRDQDFAIIINRTAGDNLSGNDPYSAYCFLLSGDEQLKIEDCCQKHGFICDKFRGSLSSSAKATPMTTQIRPSITSTVTSAAVLTGASTIPATKTMRTSTLVTSMSPTAAMTPEKQIQEYFSKMKGLNVSNEDSLQIAINETSTLLTRFHETSYPKKEANLLSATQELEKFVASYAIKHLKTGKNFSRTTIRKNFVMTMQKINVGHKNDVTFPSDDNGKLLSYERKEEIILPAELFKREDAEPKHWLYRERTKFQINFLVEEIQNACKITVKINLSTDKSRRFYSSKDSIHRYQDAEGPGIFLYKRYAGDQCS